MEHQWTHWAGAGGEPVTLGTRETEWEHADWAREVM